MNGKAELVDKVILYETKNKLGEANGMWVEQLHEVYFFPWFYLILNFIT